MKHRIGLILICLTATFFAGSFLNAARAQKTFSHTTPAHREKKYSDCNVCHTLPTGNWLSRRADKDDPFPDVRNYPFNESRTKGSHTTCVGCHASDFFKPNFCLGCHTKPGPNLGAKDIRPFPNKSHGTQFTTIFPHDAHQDIIASNERRDDVAVGHFVFVSYTRAADVKKGEFYNCSVCHTTAAAVPQWAARLPVTDEKPPAAQKEDFKPTEDFFKGVPQNHASCFSCHYQLIKPVSTDCAGCHKFADKRYTPSAIVARSSLKFSHEQLGKNEKVGERVHAKDCMTCHLGTASSSDLQALKNKKESEVRFSTCASCHEGHIKEEIKKRENDKAFQCNYCHTTAIGRYAKPDSHK